jgi:hypothetical protein
MQEHAQPTIPTSFTRDILPLFRPKDIDHMRNRAGDARIDLTDVGEVTAKQDRLVERIGHHEMPPAPDPHWTVTQLELFNRWVEEDFPT